jgi:hypothetical protein
LNRTVLWVIRYSIDFAIAVPNPPVYPTVEADFFRRVEPGKSRVLNGPAYGRAGSSGYPDCRNSKYYNVNSKYF